MKPALARAAAACALAFISGACFSTSNAPGPPPLEVLTDWTRFEHDLWASVLRQVVDEEGRVDYERLVTEPTDLERVVSLMAAVGPETRPDLFPDESDRLAYYLNAYNALVMWQVVERWPLGSVADKKVRFFYLTRLPLDGDVISLYDLENDVIRGEFDEPRIHFALNCASGGCPKLPREPFRAAELEDQLARETRRFLNDPANLRVEGDTLVLSSIFDWYEEDFAPSPLEWVRELRPQLGLSAGAKVEYADYDWSLNVQSAPAAAP